MAQRDSGAPRARGVSLVPFGRRHYEAVSRGLSSGSAASTTRYRMPRSAVVLEAQWDAVPVKHRYAIVADRTVVGFCGLRPPVFAGLELWIAIFSAANRGAGIGTFAVRTLCDYGFAARRLTRIELGVYPDNRTAIACYSRCGFQPEALLRRFFFHDGKWRDLLWMSILRDEWRSVTLR